MTFTAVGFGSLTVRNTFLVCLAKQQFKDIQYDDPTAALRHQLDPRRPRTHDAGTPPSSTQRADCFCMILSRCLMFSFRRTTRAEYMVSSLGHLLLLMYFFTE